MHLDNQKYKLGDLIKIHHPAYGNGKLTYMITYENEIQRTVIIEALSDEDEVNSLWHWNDKDLSIRDFWKDVELVSSVSENNHGS
jgi:hypothetical protein